MTNIKKTVRKCKKLYANQKIMLNNYHKIMRNKFWIISNLNKCLNKLNNNQIKMHKNIYKKEIVLSSIQLIAIQK